MYQDACAFYPVAKSPAQETAYFADNVNDANALHENKWVDVTIPAEFPDDVCAVQLHGILILTAGSRSEVANLTAAFRAPGETRDFDYSMQCVEANRGGGQRSNASVTVPVVDRKFQIKWSFASDDDGASWPTTTAFALNLAYSGYYTPLQQTAQTVDPEAFKAAVHEAVQAELANLRITMAGGV